MCQKGYYYNSSRQECVICPVGWYSEAVDQDCCLQCPGNLTTRGEGAIEPTECGKTMLVLFEPKSRQNLVYSRLCIFRLRSLAFQNQYEWYKFFKLIKISYSCLLMDVHSCIITSFCIIAPVNYTMRDFRSYQQVRTYLGPIQDTILVR